MSLAPAQRLIHETRLFLVALQFFTRVPVPSWVGFQPAWLNACARYFPLVGALVGLAGALVTALAGQVWPPAVAVLLGMGATLLITGAFHEDGWADTCDALGGVVPRDRALAIMKDSRLGTYGTVGLTGLLALKAVVLTALLTPRPAELSEAQHSHIHQVLLGWTMMALVWCHAASRLAPVAALRWMRYAGDAEHAKAKPLATRVGTGALAAAAVVLGVVAAILSMLLGLSGWPVSTLWRALAWSGLAVALAAALTCLWTRRRLGGYTGDTLGAVQQLGEVAGLLAWLAVVHPVA